MKREKRKQESEIDRDGVVLSRSDYQEIKRLAKAHRREPVPQMVTLRRTAERMIEEGQPVIIGWFNLMHGLPLDGLTKEQLAIVHELDYVQSVYMEEWRKAGGKLDIKNYRDYYLKVFCVGKQEKTK